MGADGVLSLSTVLGFFLTLVRLSGVFVFVPLPGLKSAVDPARILLVLGLALGLFPVWPHPAEDVRPGLFMAWVVSEAALDREHVFLAVRNLVVDRIVRHAVDRFKL